MSNELGNRIRRLILCVLGLVIGAWAVLLMGCVGAPPAYAQANDWARRNPARHIVGESLATYGEELASYTPDPVMAAAGYLPWYAGRRDRVSSVYAGRQSTVYGRSVARQYDYTYTTGRGDVQDRSYRRAYSETVVESVR